ncbi:DUF1481 domain-containing protein [Vibrio agarivorans]|uniref:DUF1481 domain-containing protein n=1 Tax=Vibrio agarivorans TaxID=153622 RepID=A0ABT7Y2R9_9VIBR|nr:DUF1481 domain-containing protein [Vibrio agarivorans]MDN2482281.1 DUF1481 domain-containing protein [Vibrio agarivorans]
MNRKLLLTLLPFTLVGCASSVPSTSLDQIQNFSGGQIVGDATSLYWSSERLVGQPISASDYVAMGDYGQYQTEYRWEEGVVRELVREGTQLDDDVIKPFRLHIRFNKEGEAVYQRYRVDSNVLPVRPDVLTRLIADAARAVDVSRAQDKQGFDLIQGYWDGQEFSTCSGLNFDDVTFNEPLPKVLMGRLASVDSYVAFVGEMRSTRIEVEKLLILDDDSRDCIERPQLIED